MYGAGMLLLAAVAGYWVLERAQKQKGHVKTIGQVLGLIVIVVSLLSVGCRVWSLSSGKAGCCAYAGKGKQGWSCPYARKASGPPATQ